MRITRKSTGGIYAREKIHFDTFSEFAEFTASSTRRQYDIEHTLTVAAREAQFVLDQISKNEWESEWGEQAEARTRANNVLNCVKMLRHHIELRRIDLAACSGVHLGRAYERLVILPIDPLVQRERKSLKARPLGPIKRKEKAALARQVKHKAAKSAVTLVMKSENSNKKQNVILRKAAEEFASQLKLEKVPSIRQFRRYLNPEN